MVGPISETVPVAFAMGLVPPVALATIVVGSSNETPTGSMVLHPTTPFPGTEIAQRLARAFRLAVDDPEFLRGSNRDELALSYLSGPDWAASMAERRARYEAIWNGAGEKR